MSEVWREELRELVERMPQDSAEREAFANGLDTISASEGRRLCHQLRRILDVGLGEILEAREDALAQDRYLPACGACGRVLRDGDEHDTQACWDKRPCRSCGEVHGYRWDHDRNKKVCKGCGHERDIV